MKASGDQALHCTNSTYGDPRQPPDQHDTEISARREERPRSSSTPSAEVPTFSGETSITHNLTVVEGRLEQMGVQYAGFRSTSPSSQYRSRLTPSPESPHRYKMDREMSFTQRVLAAHGILPNRVQWEGLMHTFCDEVHVLVPFLHIPSLWMAFEESWDTLLNQKSRNHGPDVSQRFQAAHVLLCLANGRCVESSRFEGDEGPYSAGWSLYGAARDMFGDLLDGFRQCPDQIFLLQTVLLMVVYLFRLDAHGSAEKVLALTISHAHHLGLQREKVVAAMNPFEGEMARRLWWCIYLLDRRLAIETGRPFLIQDVNVDVQLPHDVSDRTLTAYRRVPHSSKIGEKIKNGPTVVPYLIAMTSYSRVIGKVWEALYGAATSDTSPSTLLNEYLEHLITQSQKGIHREFTYDPLNPGDCGSEGLAWWQVKQQFMMRIRWSSIYLLIRKPMLQRASLSDQPDIIENEVICMRLAQQIIDDFSNVPEEHPKYTFPFLHYLTSATIIALGLIIKQPSFRANYDKRTLAAARSLRNHCRKTWMSGEMVRAVWKLNQMADAILVRGEQSPERHGRVSNAIPESHLLSHNRRNIREHRDMRAQDSLFTANPSRESQDTGYRIYAQVTQMVRMHNLMQENWD
ncbi:hypothetical protein N7532_002896 [Penicillium argentinense]|uniref:Xylanolytic transcriptional activator regulatory domain-containing protein n=1 Tax=Penicillium argentinense TaxID=1131581 RepID=A0A9W9KLM3_9EURO|nr:uncharacterized protein N7532_002896 [Penicillium argentinense]KAJ5110251.1 hypothetical protein N7532_002896 [Penicillium argentinense]